MILTLFLQALLVTIIVEFAVLALWLRRDYPFVLLNSVLINTFTFPLATLAYWQWHPNLLAIEAAVMGVEAILIRLLFPVSLTRALAISVTANGASALVGLAWPL